jgi:hypothetical protein
MTMGPLSLVACGGGAALMHPAHTLPQNRVSAGAGVSGQFVFGQGQRAIDTGKASGAPGAISGGANEQQFLAGAAANAVFAPGVSPWVGARVGLGQNFEAGLAYTGRTARIDARHAFGNDSFALSIGAGASAVIFHPTTSADSATPQLSSGRFQGTTGGFAAGGFGFDVPVIVGWRSTASVVQVWGGARAGFERVAGDVPVNADSSAALESTITAHRWWGGGLVGAAVGFEPFWIALELDVAYQSLSASASFPPASGVPGQRGAEVTGVSLSPTGALIGKF